MAEQVADDGFGFFNATFPGGVTVTPDQVIMISGSGSLAGLGPKAGQSCNPGALGFGAIAVNPVVDAVVIRGSSDVLINGRQAGRIGDPVNRLDVVVAGSSSVYINGKPATRRSDLTAKKRKIVTDANQVFIG